MVNKDFFQALEDLEQEKKINKEQFVATLEAALTSAYKKLYAKSKDKYTKTLYDYTLYDDFLIVWISSDDAIRQIKVRLDEIKKAQVIVFIKVKFFFMCDALHLLLPSASALDSNYFCLVNILIYLLSFLSHECTLSLTPMSFSKHSNMSSKTYRAVKTK